MFRAIVHTLRDAIKGVREIRTAGRAYLDIVLHVEHRTGRYALLCGLIDVFVTAINALPLFSAGNVVLRTTILAEILSVSCGEAALTALENAIYLVLDERPVALAFFHALRFSRHSIF